MKPIDPPYALRMLPRTLLGWTLVGCTLVAAGPAVGSAFAEDKGKAAKKGKSKEYSFEDDVIETQYLRPDTANVEGINKNKRNSLIRIRMNFFAELIRSAEDL